MSEETDDDLPKEVVTAPEASNDSFATSTTIEPPHGDETNTSGDPETEEGTEATDDIDDEDVEEEEEDDEQEDEEEEDNDDEPDEDTAGEEEPVKEIPPVDPEQLYSSPIYAQLCSFFSRFCVTLGMKPVDFDRIERMFCVFEGGKTNRDLVELHITLLRKISMKGARMDKWEMFLRKFCTMMPSLEDETRQLERLGYIELPLETKLTILNTLCCSQFDRNIKLRENIFNTYNAFELRMLPIGCDKNSLNYYYQQDASLNVRVFTEEPDDESGGTWKIVVRSVPELCRLINALKRSDFGVVEDEDEDSGEAVKKEVPEGENAPCPSIDNSIPMPTIPEGSDLKSAFAQSCKKGMFVDLYQDDAVLNRKKNERLQKKQLKQEKAASVESTVAKSEPVEEEGEDAEENVEVKKKEEDTEKESTPKESTPILDEESLQSLEDSDRRILPRRTARSCALKMLTASARKQTKPRTETPKKEVHHSEEEQEDNDDEFEDDGSDELRSSDDEFMPKSAKRGLRKRRARNVNGDTPKKAVKKKKLKPAMVFEESDESDVEEQQQKERKKATDKSLCLVCKKANKPEVLLLCDMCDDACHTFCLRPPLWYVPDDDWFCPKCNHQMLVDKLTFVYHLLREELVKKEEEDKRKALAAEKLKREMEYIGISLNNVIPSRSGGGRAPVKAQSDSEEESDEPDDGQRRSKKKALKRVMRQKPRPSPAAYYGPIVTIAEGRSRRRVTKVDYKFGAYDDLIQEAMEEIDETLPGKRAAAEADARPQGGIGNKDMANIINAEKKRKAEAEAGEEEGSDEEKPRAKKPKPAHHHRKLTDLNDDDASESESDEYQASEGSVKAADDDSDEYIPSDEARRLRSGGGRLGRSRSMDDFVVSDSDSDYDPSSKKKGKKKSQPKTKKKAKRGRRRYDESTTEEEEEDEEDEVQYHSEASSSDDNRRKKRKAAAQSKWAPPKSSSEEDELEIDDDDQDEDVERTETGRPLRRAVKAKKLASDSEEFDDEEEEEEKPMKEQRPVGALTRIRRKSDEEDFQPGEEDEEDEEEDEEEEAGASMVKIKRVSEKSPEKEAMKSPEPAKPVAKPVPPPVAERTAPLPEPLKPTKPPTPSSAPPQNGASRPAAPEQPPPPAVPAKPVAVRRPSAGAIKPPPISTPPISIPVPATRPQSFNIPPSTSTGAFAPPPHGALPIRHPVTMYQPPAQPPMHTPYTSHHMPVPYGGYYPQHPGVRYAVPQPYSMPTYAAPPPETSWYAHQVPPVDIYGTPYRPPNQGPPPAKIDDMNAAQQGANNGNSAESESLGHALAGAMHSDLM